MVKDTSKTQGERKFQYYFEDVISSKEFQEQMENLREKFNVPKNGFPSSVQEQSIDDIEPFLPPKIWVHYSNSKKLSTLWKGLDKIAVKYNLYETIFEFMLFEYYFFGRLDYSLSFGEVPDLCLVRDLVFETTVLEDPRRVESISSNIKEMYERSTAQYPIALCISPYASFNDILAFLKKNRLGIVAKQKKYAVSEKSIGNHRNRITKEVYNFIYKNRHLPRREISELVEEKFGKNIDPMYARKIISNEKKKREQV